MRALLEAMIRGETPPPPVATLVGMRLVEVGDGEARFELEADPSRHMNPMGTLHGGILCDMADGAMGWPGRASSAKGETLHHARAEDQLPQAGLVRDSCRAGARRARAAGRSGSSSATCRDAKGTSSARTSTLMTLRGEMAAGR